MKFILGEKIEMTQKFAEDGKVIPVTKVSAGPCVVTQVKTEDKDGYSSVQVGFGNKKNISKSVKGHLKDLGSFKYLKEFRIDQGQDLKVGDKITTNVFESGDVVKVTGTSKGRGFQGVVKRHGFHGSPASHGHKDQLRMPGSIGSTGPARVFKGVRMGGQMGGDQVTVTNLEVVDIDLENNTLYVKGAIPGARGSLIQIIAPGEMKLELPVVEEKKEEVKEDAAAPEVENKEEKPVEEKKEEPTEKVEEKQEEPKKEEVK